jgi:hypothetical protein
MHHAEGLLSVIKGAISVDADAEVPFFFGQHIAWVLDSILSLHAIHAALEQSMSQALISLSRMALELSTSINAATNLDTGVSQKASTVLIMLIRKIVGQPDELLKDDETGTAVRQVVCLACVQISKAAMEYSSISRLVVSHVFSAMETIPSDNPLVGPETDIWVGPGVSFRRIVPC